VNPCTAGERLYQSARVDKLWTFDDEEAFLRSAPAHLHLPLLLALWTGQRQGDLLRLTWSAYDGSVIKLRPRKTISRKRPRGKPITVPVGAPLKAALDEAAKVKASPIILVSTDNKPWTEAGFRASFNKARLAAGIVGVTFNDLRGTAITRLALTGATEPEIATITGHSLKDVCAILDAHYLNRDPELAWNAIRKLDPVSPSASRRRNRKLVRENEMCSDFPNCAPNCANVSNWRTVKAARFQWLGD